MFAICAPGLEPILASEINKLGFGGAQRVAGGVTFTGTLTTLYEANLQLRTASRVIVRIAEFHASSFHELERRANKIPWENHVASGSRVLFRVTCRKSKLYHSDGVAERIASAVAKRVDRVDFSPGADSAENEDLRDDVAHPRQLFIVRLTNDDCVISADSSGELLHRRGYRQAGGKAPLRETLAAAMVIASGWDERSPLIDPLCGSGTIPIEAALIARRIAAGRSRRFGFEELPEFDRAAWDSVKAKALEAELPASNASILASDRDDGVVISARENAFRAGVHNDIEVTARPISAIEPPASPGWIVTNPPYGVRVGERPSLRNLYAQLGKVLRSRAPNYNVGLLTSNSTLESMMHLTLREEFRTQNGGIPVRFVKGMIG